MGVERIGERKDNGTLRGGVIALETEAARLRKQLSADLASTGAVRSQQWRDVFERTPRHVFVPRVYRRTAKGRVLVDGARMDQQREWLRLVYSDDSLATRMDAGTGRPVSSSSQPSLMALMLETLAVEAGSRTLEIGTGTGYNAALLCERLGSDLVTTIDVDPELVAEACERLNEAGYKPTVDTADGAIGYLRCAPYDRIIATCGVGRIPMAWIAQAAPSAVIVVNVRGGLSGGLVRLDVQHLGASYGRFLPEPAAFIAMRGAVTPEPPIMELVTKVMGGVGASRSATIPDAVEDDGFVFFTQLCLPHVVQFGTPNTTSINDAPCLVDLRDGSWSRVTALDDGGGRMVFQHGPQMLWDIMERAYDQWRQLGRPSRERFGLTVGSDDRQIVWLDDPRSSHVWDLDW